MSMSSSSAYSFHPKPTSLANTSASASASASAGPSRERESFTGTDVYPDQKMTLPRSTGTIPIPLPATTSGAGNVTGTPTGTSSRPRARTSLPPGLGHGHGHAHGIGQGQRPGDTSMRREDSLGFASGNESTPGPPGSGVGRAIKKDKEGDKDKDGKPKKKKRKGWKGWAMVVEDEDGNVLEIRDGPEVDAEAKEAALDEAEVEAEGEPGTDSKVEVLDGQESGGANAQRGEERSGVDMKRQEEGEGHETVVAAPDMRRHSSGTGHGTRTREGTATGTVESPLTTSSPDASIIVDGTREKSISPLPQAHKVPTATLPSSASTPALASLRAKPPSTTASKKRRRNSTSATPNPPHDSNPAPAPAAASSAKPSTSGTGAGPRHSLPKSKPLRPINHVQPTRAQPSRQPLSVKGDSTQPTSTSATPAPSASNQFIDEAPLPKAPRVGMGEVHQPPAESDIRGEAMYIIQTAEKYRQQHEADRLTPPPTRDGTFPRHGASIGVGLSDGSGSTSNHPPTTYVPGHPLSPPHSDSTAGDNAPPTAPLTGTSRPHRSTNGKQHAQSNQAASKPNTASRPANSNPNSNSNPNIAGPKTVSLNTQPEEPFEVQFARVQEAYAHGIKYRIHPDAPCERSVPVKGLDDANPPEFERDASPQVVLAPAESKKVQPRDGVEKAHREGYEGLREDLEIDAQGFVNNVKDNLRNILAYYFPYPSANRDAFLEKIGRGLADMGWQLTDSSDGAV